ncbi:MAG: ABC transporter ATP-binding protein/permease [Clostridia bacterium]|nr:ABC transporter ATP-binding protein/permease [Clostridia bacterium]
MRKILSYLGDHKAQVLIILVLLIVQVYCDLALPQYTSDIVDVGIQQGGIESCVPEYISQETLDNLGIFINDEDYDTVKNQYELDGGKYVLKGKEDLSQILAKPMFYLYMLNQQDQVSIEQLKLIPKEVMLSKIDEFMDSAASEMTVSDSLMEQAAVQGVRAEYERLGIDQNKVQMAYLWHEGLIMILLTLVMILAAIAVGYFASKVGAEIGRDTRKKVFTKVLSFSHKEMEKFGAASLITRNTNDIQQVQMVIVVLLRIVMMAPIMGIGACVKVASTHTGMGWIVGCAVGIIFILVATLMVIAMPKFKIMQSLIDKVNLVSREIITGIPVIRAFSRERHEEDRFDDASRDLMKTQIFTHRTMAFMMPSMMVIMNVIAIGIVWFGAKGIDAGNLQVGDMMAFITYTMQVVISFMMLTVAAIMVPRAGVAAERISDVLSTEVTILDPEKPKKIEDVKGKVEFKDVHFRHDDAVDDAIDGVSFVAEPGKTTAIIGSTGSGKSTLINLIPRFFDVTSGAIEIDGIDIREMTQEDLRSLIGYVPQKGILFSGDIASNIKFASSDISDEEMEKAAKIAQAMEFIDEKEERFASPIAQGGTNVSGGQKQRLSIARAIAKNPKIYIFDDSFSALDYKTDAALRKMLFEETGDSTVLIVAQRIATILSADKIIVLEDGKIVGEGTHGKLLKTCETYREIAESQLSEEELAMGGDVCE